MVWATVGVLVPQGFTAAPLTVYDPGGTGLLTERVAIGDLERSPSLLRCRPRPPRRRHGR